MIDNLKQGIQQWWVELFIAGTLWIINRFTKALNTLKDIPKILEVVGKLEVVVLKLESEVDDLKSKVSELEGYNKGFNQKNK
jgi:hypothetical protein